MDGRMLNFSMASIKSKTSAKPATRLGLRQKKLTETESGQQHYMSHAAETSQTESNEGEIQLKYTEIASSHNQTTPMQKLDRSLNTTKMNMSSASLLDKTDFAIGLGFENLAPVYEDDEVEEIDESLNFDGSRIDIKGFGSKSPGNRLEESALDLRGLGDKY